MTYNKNVNYNNKSKSFRFKNKSNKNYSYKKNVNNNKKNVNKKKIKKHRTVGNYYNNYSGYNYPGFYYDGYNNMNYSYYSPYNYYPPYYPNDYYHYSNPSTNNDNQHNTNPSDIVLDEQIWKILTQMKEPVKEAEKNVDTKLSNDFKNQTPEDNVPFSIETLDDLIKICQCYDSLKKENKKYNIDIDLIKSMEDSLNKLNQMIGISDIKQSVFDIMTYYLQGLADVDNDMLHTVIEGPPGVGKTEVAKILGKMYQKYRNNGTDVDNFVIAKRSDLIGGYLGQTAIKTQKVLDSAKNGVLFIDEAYSIGDDESSKDSYSRECVNTLNAHLSENKNEMICIIAGYADSLDKYFFSMNEGLKRRFPYRLRIGDYSSEQIKQIFLKKVHDSNWNCVDNPELSEFFETHRESFQYNGGDMETLVHKCKTAYSKRIINLPPLSSKDRKLILIEDVKSAYQVFMDNKKIEVEDKSKIEGFYI
jgi:SpoVK/Ycf46/Vps4 family AAA+-type ATPase